MLLWRFVDKIPGNVSSTFKNLIVAWRSTFATFWNSARTRKWFWVETWFGADAVAFSRVELERKLFERCNKFFVQQRLILSRCSRDCCCPLALGSELGLWRITLIFSIQKFGSGHLVRVRLYSESSSLPTLLLANSSFRITAWIFLDFTTAAIILENSIVGIVVVVNVGQIGQSWMKNVASEMLKNISFNGYVEQACAYRTFCHAWRINMFPKKSKKKRSVSESYN